MKRETKKSKQQADINLRKNPINVFTCCGKTFTAIEFQAHLDFDHKLAKEQRKGKRQMIAHMDGDYWFSSTYQWEFESGLKFTQHIEMARDLDDPMRMP